ncbi:hypothetical protein DPMN_056131 [Dreissena polymorpha]|uniref:Uncharacterized protein n=1 Tax=Dreissena polymorpha TaxID=45954 RepID=A0A9D4HTB8_DREPO|nr:hypothetical protein DPMN_056131 [Dreissena polymorpha]
MSSMETTIAQRRIFEEVQMERTLAVDLQEQEARDRALALTLQDEDWLSGHAVDGENYLTAGNATALNNYATSSNVMGSMETTIAQRRRIFEALQMEQEERDRAFALTLQEEDRLSGNAGRCGKLFNRSTGMAA